MDSLIKSIATVKRYMQVSAMIANSSLPDFVSAQRRYIFDLLGKDLYAEIATEAATLPANPSELLDLVYRAIIPLAYYSDLATMAVNITQMGVGVTTGENFQSAPRWLFQQTKEALENKACAAMEDLFLFLYETKPDNITWTINDQYNTIINTGKGFNKHFNLYQPYRTFESLRFIVKKVEDDSIRPLIGDEFFEALRDSTEATGDELKVITLLKKAVAYLTIKEACELLPVRIGADGFTVALDRNTDMTNQGQQQAPANQMSALMNACSSSGNAYLATVIEFLNKNASSELFPIFFESEHYTPIADDIQRSSDNAGKAIFTF